MDLAFNELCIEENASVSESTVMRCLGDLFQVVRFAQKISGPSCRLRTKSDFWDKNLCGTNSLRKLVHRIGKDECRFLLSKATRAPYLDSNHDPIAYSRQSGFEARVKGISAEGIGAAWLLDGIAVSFLTEEKWNTDKLSVRVLELNDMGELTGHSADVRHVSLRVHIEKYASYYRDVEHCKKQITCVRELREVCSNWFPSLIFGDDFFSELDVLPLRQQEFWQVVSELYWLNDFFAEEIPKGNFALNTRKSSTQCSPESKATMQQYGDERLFRFNGALRCCEWHFKLFKNRYRLHFDPDFAKQKAYIGYIGKHLRTATG